MAGFVSIMSNPAFPQLLKIGKLRKDPTGDRVKELNQTGVPEPFKVEYYAFVSDETKIEKAVHHQFQSLRPNHKKEFFSINVFAAVDATRATSKKLGGIKYEEIFYQETCRKRYNPKQQSEEKGTKGKGKANEKIFSDKFGRYEGQIKDGVEHGFGTRIFKNGNRYTSEFKQGKFCGAGVLTLADGHKYEGEFRDGFYSGKGRLFYPNGNIFEGSFKNSQRHGYGILTLKSGTTYDGK